MTCRQNASIIKSAVTPFVLMVLLCWSKHLPSYQMCCFHFATDRLVYTFHPREVQPDTSRPRDRPRKRLTAPTPKRRHYIPPHVFPCSRLSMTLQDPSGPVRTRQDLSGPVRTRQDPSGPVRTPPGPFQTHLLKCDGMDISSLGMV